MTLLWVRSGHVQRTRLCLLWVISGHKLLQQVMSALPPIATAKADILNKVMSALLPKADMCSATSSCLLWAISCSAGPSEIHVSQQISIRNRRN